MSNKRRRMTPQEFAELPCPPLTDLHLIAAKDGGVLVCMDYPPDGSAVDDGRRETFALNWTHAQLLEACDLFRRAIVAFPDVPEEEQVSVN